MTDEEFMKTLEESGLGKCPYIDEKEKENKAKFFVGYKPRGYFDIK